MINPDRENKGLSKIIPNPGDLRWHERIVDRAKGIKDVRDIRLQRFEWSYTQNKYDWYDVPEHVDE